MGRACPKCTVAPPPTLTRSSKAPSPATSPWSSQPSSSWPSSSTPPRRSGSQSHHQCCCELTRSSSERRVIDRRAFITTVGASLLAAPLAIQAQQAGKVWWIGVLTTGDPRSAPPANWEGFLQGLRESGYVEGQNVA